MNYSRNRCRKFVLQKEFKIFNEDTAQDVFEKNVKLSLKI